MRSTLEQIQKKPGSSFRLLVNPKMSDFYYWHFHPELELVFIEGVDGPRQVGNYKSRYNQSDLVFIGSYIPHLNFDFGVKGSYYKIVLQIDHSFLNFKNKSTPELDNIKSILEKSKYGIAFSGKTKKQIGEKLKNLIGLDNFQNFINVVEILNDLAKSQEFELLHSKPYQNEYYQKQQDKIQTVIQFINNNYQRKISIQEMARLSNYSESAFCRYFKKMTKLSFTTFLNNYRVDIAKSYLLEGSSVSEAAFSSGFESLSYFNRVFKKVTGTSPIKFTVQSKK